MILEDRSLSYIGNRSQFRQRPDKCDLFTISMNMTSIPWRFACPIESALILYRNSSVCLYHDEQLNISSDFLGGLKKKFSNLRFVKIDLLELFQGTAAEEWFLKTRLRSKKKNQFKELVDALRLVILLKQDGGMYFDLDLIHIQRLESCASTETDVLGYEIDRKLLNCALYCFQESSVFLRLLVENIGRVKTGWGVNCCKLVTNLYSQVDSNVKSAIKVLTSHQVHGVHYSELSIAVGNVEKEGVFKNKLNRIMNESFFFHQWRLLFEHHELSWGHKLGEEKKGAVEQLSSKSLISSIWSQRCPFAYETVILPKIHSISHNRNHLDVRTTWVSRLLFMCVLVFFCGLLVFALDKFLDCKVDPDKNC